MGRMFFNNLTMVSGFTSLHEMENLIKMIEFKQLDVTPIITHEFRLSDIMEAYRVFQNRLDNCIKVMIVPD
jgi:alcohol dehydrogenase